MVQRPQQCPFGRFGNNALLCVRVSFVVRILVLLKAVFTSPKHAPSANGLVVVLCIAQKYNRGSVPCLRVCNRLQDCICLLDNMYCCWTLQAVTTVQHEINRYISVTLSKEVEKTRIDHVSVLRYRPSSCQNTWYCLCLPTASSIPISD